MSSKQALREHRNLHTGEMPHKCDKCGLCFSQGSQLSIHKKIHIEERQANETGFEIDVPLLTDMLSFVTDLPPIGMESSEEEQNIHLPIQLAPIMEAEVDAMQNLD